MRFVQKSSCRKFVVLFTIGFIYFTRSASEASGQAAIINQIIARMDAYNKSLSALTANITVVSIDANFGPSPAEYGELKYAPDKSDNKEKRPSVRIDFKKPERYISIAKGKYSIYQPLTNQAYTGPTSSVKGQTQGGAGMLSFMSMNSDELKKNYKFEYLDEATVRNSKNELTWHLRLTPLIPAKYKYAEIWVTKDGLPVQTMIVAVNKDSTTMLMTSHNDRAKINLDTIPIVIPRTANIHVEK
jgi:hypothetical protein